MSKNIMCDSQSANIRAKTAVAPWLHRARTRLVPLVVVSTNHTAHIITIFLAVLALKGYITLQSSRVFVYNLRQVLDN